MFDQRGLPPRPIRGYNESAETYLDRLGVWLDQITGNAAAGVPEVYDTAGRVILSGRGLYAYAADGSLPIAPNIVQIDTQHLVDAAVELAKLDQDQVVTCTPKVIAGDIVTLSLLAGDLEAVEARIGNLKVNRANIANAAIGSAQIEDAAITNAKIGNLSADKITAGFLSVDRLEANSINFPKLTSGAISTVTLASGSAVTLSTTSQNLLTFSTTLRGDGIYVLLATVRLVGNNGFSGAGKFGAKATIGWLVNGDGGSGGGSHTYSFGSATTDDAETAVAIVDAGYFTSPGTYTVSLSGQKAFGNTVEASVVTARLLALSR